MVVEPLEGCQEARRFRGTNFEKLCKRAFFEVLEISIFPYEMQESMMNCFVYVGIIPGKLVTHGQALLKSTKTLKTPFFGFLSYSTIGHSMPNFVAHFP